MRVRGDWRVAATATRRRRRRIAARGMDLPLLDNSTSVCLRDYERCFFIIVFVGKSVLSSFFFFLGANRLVVLPYVTRVHTLWIGII
jgi:hypothetical protein